MIRTVPLTAVQAAVFKTLNDNLTGYPVMDDSTPFESGKLPGEEFVIIGSITAVPQGTNGTFPLEGYSLIMLNIESVEARAEDWNDDEVWQHGIVRVAITVEQDKY